ncbi:MAG: FHA domain-containing protein [Steroidobacteraceae bacterium]
MAIRTRSSPPVEVDLEATAELPLIDFSTATSARLPALPDDEAGATDVFSIPVAPDGTGELPDILREVEQRLQRNTERVQALEAELAAANGRSSTLEAQLAGARRELAERESVLQQQLVNRSEEQTREQAAAARRQSELSTELGGLRDELGSARAQLQQQRTALEQSQKNAEQAGITQQNLQSELIELRRRGEQQFEALSSWQGFRAVSTSMLTEVESALHDAESQFASEKVAMQGRLDLLDADMKAARDRTESLETELAQARSQHTERETALHKQLAERADQLLRERGLSAEELRVAAERLAARESEAAASLAARDAELATLKAQLAELRELEDAARHSVAVDAERKARIDTLEAELATVQARLGEAEDAGVIAAERIRRLETEARASAALFDKLHQNIERLGREDAGQRGAAVAAPAESLKRVLVRQEGGADVVYPLSRRTSIGRTPDNDIQVDTVHVSRHHAVLLSNSDHCIVEDLNSTNGVLVNGRRVGRQILHDGDAVTIGRTEFRYQQRS